MVNIMRLGGVVRVYDDDWFDEGRITEIENGSVTVDFFDWKQRYISSELQVRYIHFKEVWVAMGAGETIEDFRI